ncbi:hypothetical protein [Peribacillus loiseleuriae]|uniref:hypothetical protein n=1 Tax=Peribacillus loiseleuriae TaxID=1679170 RepID=UPI003CCC2102
MLTFLTDHSLSFRDIGFPEVKAYNKYIKKQYAVKSAIRKLEFFRRLLSFGYETQFYKAHLSTWITKRVSKKRTLYNRRNSSPRRTNTRTSQGIESKRGEYLIPFSKKKWEKQGGIGNSLDTCYTQLDFGQVSS